MSSVAQLVWLYFARMPALRWLTLASVVAILTSAVVLPYYSGSGLGHLLAFLGGAALIPAAALMPLTVGRLARSHAICVLPCGRVKLFLSALITVLIVSLPIPVLSVIEQVVLLPPSVAAMSSTSQKIASSIYIFSSLYVGAFLVVTWLYIAIWFATSERNVRGLAKCLLVVIALIWLPSERIRELDPKFHLTVWESILMWTAFGSWLAYGTSLRGRKWIKKPSIAWRLSSHADGREVDVLLGTARPWLLTLGVLFPIALQLLVGFQLESTWLFYLTLTSTAFGALAGYAAERSRALWLRTRWSRDELFAQVEMAFWKHNSIKLVALLALLIGVARVYQLPARVVPLGVPLIVLGMILSTYLGLMLTRGLRWAETTLGVVIMLAVMGTAVLAARDRDYTTEVLALEGVFALIAIVLRQIARVRWHHIDWALLKTGI
jgi:hypothetical protein